MKSFVYLILFSIVAASLSAENKDKLCNSVSTLHSGDTPADSCHNLGAEGAKLTVFLWILFHRNPLYGICIDESTWKWHRHCTSRQIRSYSGDLSVNKPENKVKNGDFVSHCDPSTPVTSRSVDFLFLIDCTYQIDASNFETLFHSIESLLQYTQNRVVFHDIQTQFGFVVYSHKQKLEILYARDFSSEFPHDFLPHLSGYSVADSTVNTSASSASDYRVVGNAVRMISRFLKLNSRTHLFHQSVAQSNKKSSHFWRRPYSDFHMVSVLDVGRVHGDSKKDEEDRIANEIEQKISKLVEKIISVTAYPISFHLFFDVSNSAAVSLLGDPSLALRYPDCSHFRKASTLKALIAANQGSTFQALLLSKGIEFQTHSLKDFENSHCIMGISPVLSTPLGMQPFFSDSCVDRSQRNEKDFFCSSLHGWSRRKKDLNSGTFVNKVPLSGKYGSSHADIANSLTQSITKSDEDAVLTYEELSITKRLKNGCSAAFKPVIVGQPRIVDWKHNKPFIQEMLQGGQPAVLRGTVVETWPAVRKWNMSYLSQEMRSEYDVLKSVKCSNSFLTFDPDHRAPLKLNISLSYTLSNMTTLDFFNCIQSTNHCTDGYKGHYYFGTVPDALRKDISPDDFLYNTQRDRQSSKQFMWVSSAGMITHAHFDQDYNCFVQLVGKKRFTLWSASQHDLMYVFPRVHPMWHKSRVNYQEVDTSQFPAFTRARAVQVELGPGDMLYVPPYTWHYVETLSPSVSLSTWSHDYNLYDHMNAIYRHDHKFDLLQNQRGKLVHGSKHSLCLHLKILWVKYLYCEF